MADLQRGGHLGAGAGFGAGGPLGSIQQNLELDLGLLESRGVDVRQVIGNYIQVHLLGFHAGGGGVECA